MAHPPRLKYAKATVLMLAIILGGCTLFQQDEQPRTLLLFTDGRDAEQIRQWLDEHPCGMLQVTPPFLNVTGELTASPKPNASICLLIARNTSLAAALYTAENCPCISVAAVNASKAFSLANLPTGTYLAMIPASSFDKTRGFPIIHDLNQSNHTADTVWHGGDYRYSLGLFTIHPQADRNNT